MHTKFSQYFHFAALFFIFFLTVFICCPAKTAAATTTTSRFAAVISFALGLAHTHKHTHMRGK